MELKKLPVDALEATSATQIRVRIDKGMVDQYTEDYKNGADMPPLDVYCEPNSDRYILADGFHRHRAAINLGYTEIDCIVHQGGMLEALVHALGSNAEHGFRRTNADKRHAVEMALKDPELGSKPASEIADICRVTVRTVNRIINEQLSSEDENDSQVGTMSDPQPPEPKDFRDNGAEPTQEDVDLEEVRQANKIFRALPYAGEDSLKLDFTPDDIADLEYVSTWSAAAVIEYRKQGDDDVGS